MRQPSACKCAFLQVPGGVSLFVGVKGQRAGMTSDTKSRHISGLRIEPEVASGPTDVVRRFNEVWASGDIEGALQLVAEHSVYALHISGDLLPFAGETIGRDNIAVALHRMRADYEYLLYRPLDLVVDGDNVRYQVEFMYRHRASGEVLSGRFRMIMRVENGLLVRTDEYHDRAKVEAFLRLFGGSGAN
jgi:ketosteroid isomerase-like protein